MPSTMVMGVNHVNLSTNLKNPAANTITRVSYPVSSQILPGPHEFELDETWYDPLSLKVYRLTGHGDNAGATAV